MVRKRARLRKIQVFKLGRYLLLDKVMCGFLNLDMDVSLFWTLKGVFFLPMEDQCAQFLLFFDIDLCFFLDINWSIYFFLSRPQDFFQFLGHTQMYFSSGHHSKGIFFTFNIPRCLFVLDITLDLCLVSYLGHRSVFSFSPWTQSCVCSGH